MLLRNAFLSGLSRSVLVETFLLVVQVLVSFARDRSAAAGVEQLADSVSSGGPHGFLPGQSSAARFGAQSGVGRQRPRPGQVSTALRGRRFAGQVFLEPDAAGRVGFIESASAQAELACGGDFRFSASYLGRFFTGDDVMFSARQLPTGGWEAFDLADPHPILGATLALVCLRIQRSAWLTMDSCTASVYVAFWKNLTLFFWRFPGDDFRIVSVYSAMLGP